MNWHYVIDGKTMGPVTDMELKKLFQEGTIKADTMVWQEGMSGWEPYAKLQAVAEPAVPTQPPAPDVAEKSKTIPKSPALLAGGAGEHVACSECGTVLPSWKMSRAGSGWRCGDCAAEANSPALPSSGPPSKYRGDHAGFWIRAIARLLDVLFVALLIIVAAVGLMFAAVQTLYLYAVAAAVPVLYFTLTVGSSSTTPGKRLCGLSVATSKGYTVGYLRAFWRVLAENLGLAAAVLLALYLERTPNQAALWLLVIGLPLLTYAVVLLNPAKRGLHDYLAGTKVIKN